MANLGTIKLRILQPPSSAIQRAENAKQLKLSNYDIIRTLALRGELEAFVSLNGLDYEQNEQTFDRTLEIEGAEWLRRGGAL